jgi:hypothetical protein
MPPSRPIRRRRFITDEPTLPIQPGRSSRPDALPVRNPKLPDENRTEIRFLSCETEDANGKAD